MPVLNTVFISYRRANIYTARAVYQDLRQRNYDVFLDYNSIDNGSFERTILNQIRARGHFLLLLTPITLERCTSPDDWVRREIECALESKRNIVPLMFDDFDFAKHAEPYLSDTMQALPKYNSLRIYGDYFEEGMQRLIDRFLNKPIEATLHPDQPQPSDTNTDIISFDLLRESESLFEKGTQLVAASKWKQAWETFAQVLEINPNRTEAHYERAKIAQRMNRLDLAIHEMSEGLESDSQNYEAYRDRGIFYNQLKDYVHAIADFSRALELNPPYVSAYIGRGEARLERGDISRAISDFEVALKIAPNHPHITDLLKQARKLKRDLGNPIKNLSSALGLSDTFYEPETAREYHQRGIRLPINNHENRIADFTRALEIDPNYYRAYFSRSSVYYDLGEFDKAIADISRAIEIDTTHSNAYSNRGEFYVAKGDFAKALPDLEKAIAMKPESEYPRTALAIALFHLGRKKQACNEWLELEMIKLIDRDLEKTAKQLNWHDNVTQYAQALVDTLP